MSPNSDSQVNPTKSNKDAQKEICRLWLQSKFPCAHSMKERQAGIRHEFHTLLDHWLTDFSLNFLSTKSTLLAKWGTSFLALGFLFFDPGLVSHGHVIFLYLLLKCNMYEKVYIHIISEQLSEFLQTEYIYITNSTHQKNCPPHAPFWSLSPYKSG